MREIIFRGKRIDNGEWVYGGILQTDNWSEISVVTDYYGNMYEPPSCEVDSYEVIPETVGQYTGLTDKNGKMIFEGDIVQYYGTYALEVYIENGHTKTRWFDTVTKREYTELFFGYDEEAYGECEIVGNIYDNPELLKGGADNG